MREGRVLIFLVLFFGGLTPNAQTVGVVQHGDNVQPGYTLFSPLTNSQTYLIDECGQVINEWSFTGSPGMSAKLTPSGDIIRAKRSGSPIFNGGGLGGIIEGFTWDQENLFIYDLSDSVFHQHHDFEIMPNGNILVLGWEIYDEAAAEKVGRTVVPEGGMYSERIIEIKPINDTEFQIVWEWKVWDHLVQNTAANLPNFGEPVDFPERININFTNNISPNVKDWLHANSLDYNPERDQIIINIRNFSEFWVIDHSTTTAESAGSTGGDAGQGGDVLYRWGNSSSYEVGETSERLFFGQHDAHWVKKGLPGQGNIIVYNNGNGRPAGSYSTVEEIVTPWNGVNYTMDSIAYGPASSSIVYGEPMGQHQIFSQRISGAQRLSNGNTLVCVGNSGRFIEANPEGEIEWDYVNPSGTFIADQGDMPANSSNSVFQAFKYRYNFSGFNGKDLEPGEKIEGDPIDNCGIPLVTEEEDLDIDGYFDMEGRILVLKNNSAKNVTVCIYNSLGEVVDTYEVRAHENAYQDYQTLPSSTYFATFWAEAQLVKRIKFTLINE